jgi:PKD repeat protein
MSPGTTPLLRRTGHAAAVIALTAFVASCGGDEKKRELTAPDAGPLSLSVGGEQTRPTPEAVTDISEEHSSHFSATSLATALGNSAIVGMTQFGGHFQVDLSTVARSGFPTQGSNYVVVSSGDARNPSGVSSAFNSGCVGEAQWGTICNVGGVDVTIAVPSGAQQLTFDLRFFEWDYLPFEDPFRVFVIAPNGTSTLIAQFHNSSEFVNKTSGFFAIGPARIVTVNVAPYGGQTIRIRLQASDRSDSVNNAGALIDNFEFDGGVPPNGAPIVSIGGPYGTDEGTGIVLTAAASDPNGDELTYDWDFGDGSDHASSLNAPHTYVDNGAYTATLTVSDGKGGVTSASTTVTVADVPPTLEIIQSTTVTFRNTSVQLNWIITDPGADAPWSGTIEWGDGAVAEFPNGGGATTHSYAALGTYSIVVRVTDKDGVEATAGGQVTVINRAPIAIARSVQSAFEGSPAFFSARGSRDDDGDPLSYSWDFGDGSVGAGVLTDHVYADNAVYPVAVRVSDGYDVVIATTSATILNAAPTVIAGPGATILSGESFTLKGSFSDPGVNDAPWNFTVFWFDGPNTLGSTSSQGAINATHTYLRAATYTVVLQVWDKDQGGDAQVTTVVVQRIPVGGPAGYEVINIEGVGHGMVTIDVLSAGDVDATTIVPSSVTFGNEADSDTGVEKRNNGTYMTSVQDLNGDGRMDMSLKFRRDALRSSGDLTDATEFLVLLADLGDGRQVRGVYNVRTVPK